MLEAKKLKATGVLAGVSDLICIAPDKKIYFLELKTEKGVQSDVHQARRQDKDNPFWHLVKLPFKQRQRRTRPPSIHRTTQADRELEGSNIRGCFVKIHFMESNTQSFNSHSRLQKAFQIVKKNCLLMCR